MGIFSNGDIMKELSGGATVVTIHAFDDAHRKGMTVPTPELLLATILSIEDRPHLPFYKEVNAELYAMEQVFMEADIIMQILRDTLFRYMEREEQKEDYVVLKEDSRYREIFEAADELATGKKITCLDLLAAIFLDPTPVIKEVVENYRVKPYDLVAYCRLFTVGPPMDKRRSPPVPGESVEEKNNFGEDQPKKSATEFLDLYGKDLTAQAREKKLDPLIGRRDVMLQLVQTLGRESKNNPLLVGEPGVGKTAIVEGLANRIAEGKDPQVLKGKRLIQIHVSSLIADTQYRGQFEEKLEKMLAEAKQNPDIILFIDELHTIIGAGRCEGNTIDAANILKPALSRGDIRIIGATTLAEYHRYIESDEAFSRRFEMIMVVAPNKDEAMEILKGIRPALQKHHGIPIDDSALFAAVELSEHFDKNHYLPDKALDLVDKAAVKIRMPVLSGKAVGEGVVTRSVIAEVLAEKTGIPLTLITGFSEHSQKTKILGLEQHLKGRVVGQDLAAETVCRRLKIAYSGLLSRDHPLGVFLFMGPSGVGKTEMAKAIAEYLFGDEAALIRFDMSEFMDKESMNRLIGAPPGYTNYEKGGVLIDSLRSRPFSVILFDEVEKANPLIFDLFLQLFGEGRITDSRGRMADASNSIIVMTSNIRIDPTLFPTQPGIFSQDVSSGANEGNAGMPKPPIFRTEFLNRIDDVVVFHDLKSNDLSQILNQILDEVIERVRKSQNIRLTVDDEVKKFLLVTGYSQEFGVRELQRITERHIVAPLSEMILEGKLAESPAWRISYKDGRILVQKDA